jgi:flagellar hook protein FlgE
MSLFSALSIGASGLGASSIAISVIGDNVANINTTGFKSARPSFAVQFPHPQGTLGGTAQMGQGVTLDNIASMFTQGSLQATESALDLAITGKGFFEVKDNEQNFYTRDGTFYLQNDGYIKNSLGMRLQGFNVYNNELSTTLTDLEVSTAPIEQRETTTMSLSAILSADAVWDEDGDLVADIPYSSATKDGTSGGTSIEELSTEADFATSTVIYDSLGIPHDMTVFFEKTGDNDWNWSSIIDGGEIDFGGGVYGEDGYAMEIQSGTMTFDTDGNLSNFTSAATGTAWNFIGASTTSIDFQFGLDSSGTETDAGGIRMAGGTSTVTALDQDGFGVGNLSNVVVERDGSIVGVYSNGEELVLGQVAIALFGAESGLERQGGNLYRSTRNSGPPAMGQPDTAGRGSISSYALEKSNVELEDQFVLMIEAQRAYQGNARIINSANETLQELVNLI